MYKLMTTIITLPQEVNKGDRIKMNLYRWSPYCRNISTMPSWSYCWLCARLCTAVTTQNYQPNMIHISVTKQALCNVPTLRNAMHITLCTSNSTKCTTH